MDADYPLQIEACYSAVRWKSVSRSRVVMGTYFPALHETRVFRNLRGQRPNLECD